MLVPRISTFNVSAVPPKAVASKSIVVVPTARDNFTSPGIA